MEAATVAESPGMASHEGSRGEQTRAGELTVMRVDFENGEDTPGYKLAAPQFERDAAWADTFAERPGTADHRDPRNNR